VWQKCALNEKWSESSLVTRCVPCCRMVSYYVLVCLLNSGVAPWLAYSGGSCRATGHRGLPRSGGGGVLRDGGFKLALVFGFNDKLLGGEDGPRSLPSLGPGGRGRDFQPERQAFVSFRLQRLARCPGCPSASLPRGVLPQGLPLAVPCLAHVCGRVCLGFPWRAGELTTKASMKAGCVHAAVLGSGIPARGR